MAELFPQYLVLTKALQSRRGLSQVYDVTGVRQLVEDLVLRVKWQVAEQHAIAHLLGDLQVVELLLPFEDGL